MTQIFKSVSAQVKSTESDTEPAGSFEALVAVFGNVDLQGDVIDKGAFTDTIKSWADSGRPIPIIWSHNWDDPFAHIGGADASKAMETDTGFLIKGVLDLDNPTAAQVHKLMKDGRVDNFSFAAETADGGWSLEEKDGTVIQHLTKLNLYEVGPTLRGANPETRLIAMKSDKPTLKATDTLPGTASDINIAAGNIAADPGATGDPDDDPRAVIGAIDAVLDQAVALFGTVDASTLSPAVLQAISLVVGAQAVVDGLMDLLGIPDPDDTADEQAAKAAVKPNVLKQLVVKEGRVLAEKHVNRLTDIHKSLGDILTDVAKSPSSDSGAEENGKSAPVSIQEPRQQAKAILAELASRKDHQ